MCGSFVSGADEMTWREYCELLKLPTTTPLPSGGDSHPTQLVTAVRPSPQGTMREVTSLRWGLLPPWAKDRREGRRLFNVRSERAHEKFRAAFDRQRCVIPARAFYEWSEVEVGKKKRPFVIHDKSLPIFSMAGLWSVWRDAGEVLETCAILTTAASPLLREIHRRMPVIFDPLAADLWLRPETPTAELKELLIPYESETLKVEPLGPPAAPPAQGSLF